jgi:arylsulfatase A-like enzyme
VVAADADLTARHDEIAAWADTPDQIKPVLEREMEVYAGFLEHTDYHVGRVIDALERLDVLDDTLDFYIIAPTILEAAGIPEPAFVSGVQQSPTEGTSMMYSLNHAEAPERHDLQYFEVLGNRGVYYEGWSAATKHRTPWVLGQVKLTAFDDDVWELYDGASDWSQAHDLAHQMPDELHELQRLGLIEAVKYNVLPLDDRAAERMNPDLAGRPQLITGKSQLLFPGMKRLSENSVVSIKNKSFAVTAQ